MRRSPIRSLWIPSAVVAAVALAAPLATAFVPQEGHSLYDIPLLQAPLYETRASQALRAEETPAIEVAQRYGGTWRVQFWNVRTNTPAYLTGSGVDLSAQLTRGDEESFARRVLADNATALRIDPADLRFTTVERGMGKMSVHFQQTYRGLDVWEGRAHLTMTEAGRVFVLGSEYYAGITLDPQPSLSQASAERIAADDLGFDAATDRIQDGATLLVLPVPTGASEVEHHLVWRVRVETQDPFGIWVTHVDAHDGTIVWRYNDVHFINFTGHAEHDVEPGSYCSGIESQDLKYLRVQVTGVGEATTDQNGDWTVPYAGADQKTVTANFYGPHIRTNVQDGTGNAQFSTTALPGTSIQVAFTDANSRRDERDAFDAINDVHDFIAEFDPTFPYINQRITCNLGVSGSCNAFWNGTINFYNQGGGCANTGQIQGVVHHEFGHGIQYSILGSQGNEGLGEGNSDIIANLLTQDSVIGRGFYLNNCSSGIRNSLNTLQYPEDLNGSIHHDGQIIAGFHWDFMVLMQGLYGQEVGTRMAGERWHFGRRLEHPMVQSAQVIATFIADDDDGNLENGTPHYDQLAEAAENHGYEYPEVLVGVLFSHEPLWSTTTEGNVGVVAEAWSTEAPLVPATIKVNYQIDGGAFQSAVLTPTGSPNEYSGLITGLTQPARVSYFLSAEDEEANTGTSPRQAPAVMYNFNVALVADQMETATGWTVNLEGSDDATTGIWLRADPVGTSAQPEDDHTSGSGTHCWVTGNGSIGGGVGENDVDGGTTTVYSAEYDLSDAAEATVIYHRWYSNNQGGDPNNDLWVVQVRNDGGAWVDVENNQDDQNQWVRVEADLIAILGADLGTVQFKFIASDLGAGSIVEAAVDDFDLLAGLGFSSTPEQQPAAGLRYALHGSRSNPVLGATDFRFQVPVTTEVELSLFDVSGRTIAVLARDSFAPGLHTVPWNGSDAAGQPVAAGVYYARMRAGEYDVTRTVVVSR